MFKRLIIPLDGSRLAETVLPTALQLAEKLHASVTLVHVIERNPPKQIHGETHLAAPGEAEAYLNNIRARFPASVPVELHVHTEAIANVARSIADHTREFDSDLVIMCTHGHGGLRQWLFGSIAQQVVAARIPVLLIRPEADGTAPLPNAGPFVVPLDGTPLREAALPAAASLAKGCGTSLKLLMIVPTPGTLSGAETTSSILLPATTKALLAIAQEDAIHYLQALGTKLQAETGVKVSGLVRTGDGSKVIAEEVKNINAEWIIMGTSARTGMDAFWSGSVAPKVSSRIYRPLLLIPGAE